MSDIQGLGMASVAGAAVSGFFMWLSRRSGVRAAILGREETELSAYRKELVTRLDATQAALDKEKAERIQLMERSAVERIKLEDRIAHMEMEKNSCQEKLSEMEKEIIDLRGEVVALRRMVRGNS